MSSLVTYAGDSDGEFSDGELRDEDDYKISDEDEDTGSGTGSNRGSEGGKQPEVLSLDTGDSNSQMSNDSFPQSKSENRISTGGVKPMKRRRGLVSYSPIHEDEQRDLDDTIDDETEGIQVELLVRQDSEEQSGNSGTEEAQEVAEDPATTDPQLEKEGAVKDEFDVELPPEPAGRCSRKVQEKFGQFYEKMKRQTHSMNESIKRRKDFRNPSIYQKLVEFCGIDEKGSNYPKELFDPNSWGDSSFYESLAKAQKELMTKLEKEKKEKTKVEFLTGTVKKPSGAGALILGSTATDELPAMKQRKSKWDVPVSSSTAKSVSIPAVGTLTKKIKLDSDNGK